ncbi:MAG: hypothetical protein HY093_01585 [Candidatus Liptonbacteria bacterium]|nr:hypothetical protein [Candidatus Liptonbacteria bacterium]
MPFLIQGYAFKKQLDMVGVRVDPEEGKVPDIRMTVRGDMFYGVIHPDEEDPDELTGWMEDEVLGQSNLSEVMIAADKVEFERHFGKRRDVISYEFHLVGGVWLGKYTGDEIGTGVCQCVLTEVDIEFFKAESAMKEFGMNEPYIPAPVPT